MKQIYKGFTLIELLVAVAIVVVLGLVGLSGARSMMHRAESMVEMNAGRNLVAAYIGHAADNNMKLMPGYKSDPEAKNLNDQQLYNPINARYPWRLIPYVPKVEGVMFFNGNEQFLEDPNSDYLVSVHPNLGMNATFVGGHFGSASPLRPSKRVVDKVGKFYVSHMGEVYDSAKLLVFASARHGAGKDAKGYYEVQPPKVLRRIWTSEKFDPEVSPNKHGFVDFRWKGKALAFMMDGHAEFLDEEQMRDMRRWSNQAAREDDPDYKVTIR